ncbi:hypothetical protein AB1Y20_021217 [Prymnesium parvum]|uniref:Uncharacterized protein n=1 Tax=Prymnesium parvum TaxID=97485 RepID=A0AB34JKR8_PRYPA
MARAPSLPMTVCMVCLSRIPSAGAAAASTPLTDSSMAAPRVALLPASAAGDADRSRHRRLSFDVQPIFDTPRGRVLFYYGFLAMGGSSVLVGLLLLASRQCSGYAHRRALPPGPVWAGDDSIHVLVYTRSQEAELEMRADSFSSYEMFRELVVASLPGIFEDTDELVLDYLDEGMSWTRVKSKTPLSEMKASGTVRISCRSSKRSRTFLPKRIRNIPISST